MTLRSIRRATGIQKLRVGDNKTRAHRKQPPLQQKLPRAGRGTEGTRRCDITISSPTRARELPVLFSSRDCAKYCSAGNQQTIGPARRRPRHPATRANITQETIDACIR